MAGKRSDGRKRSQKVQARKKKQQAKTQKQRDEESQQARQQWAQERAQFSDIPPQFRDRRLMERDLADLVGLETEQTDAELEADDLYYEALETSSVFKRRKLLNESLKRNPRHIDAMVELAELTDDSRKARKLLLEAVRMGEEDLAEELVDDVGEFWGMLHTRPFMRAKQALAEMDFHSGQLDSAIEIYKEMLRLNPMDNQGVRWLLMEAYCRTDQSDDAMQLIEMFPDEGVPFLLFTGLLIQFKRNGDSPELREQLLEQDRRNPHIIPRLLDSSLLNKGSIPMFSPGSQEEADLYCQQFLSAWKSTPGAVTWLRTVALESDLDLQKEDDFDVKSVNQSLLAEVEELEVSADTWYFEVSDLGEDGWLYGVVDQFEGEVLQYDPGLEPLGRETVLHALYQTMLEPDDDRPRRPSHLEFADAKLLKMVKSPLQKLSITCEVTDERPEILERLEQMVPAGGQGIVVDPAELRQKPKSSATWEIDWRQLGQWLPNPETGIPAQPWMILVVEDENELILAQQLTMSPPDAHAILSVLGHAIEQTQSRPEHLCVLTADQYQITLQAIEELDIESSVSELGIVDELFDNLNKHMEAAAGGPAALVSLEDVTPAIVGDFFEAAAEFYRSRVWLSTPEQTIIEVECPALLPEKKYANIMGQLGEEIGVLFFDTRESIERIFQSDPSDPSQGAAEIRGLSWAFCEQEMVHPADVAAAEQFGWPVGAPEAWPGGFSVSEGKARDFTSQELQFITAGTRAVIAQLQAKKKSLKSSIPLSDQTVEVSTKISRR